MSGSDSFPRRQARTRRFTLGAPRTFRIAADGSAITFLRSSGPEDPVNGLWLLDAVTGDERLAVDPAELTGDELDLPPAERARRERMREAGGGIVSYDVDADLTVAVFALGGSLWRADLVTGACTALPAAEGAFDPRLDPHGRRVAYGAGSALRVVDLEGDRLVVDESSDTVTWGAAEFVAGEEMGRTRGHWWAPDGDRLVVERVDVAPVETWWITAPIDPATAPTQIRYPAAGTANALVGLAIFDVEAERADRVDIDWAANEWEYLADVAWTDDGLMLVVQSRDQRVLAVLDVDATTGQTVERRRVEDEHWVELVAGAPRLSNGRLITVEDRGSARRLCVDGEPVTDDGLQVRSVIEADDDGVVVAASREPTEVNIARVGFDGSITWMTDDRAVHAAVVGASTALIVKRTLGRPDTTFVATTAGAEHTIANHAAPSGLELNAEIVSLGPRRLWSAIILPAPSPERANHEPLPVLLDPYGGPHMQRVQRAHALFDTAQWFADQGFAVVVTDGRGTPGRGPEFERSVRADLAGPVLEDQIDALHAAAELDPRLDLSRVAIRGWSFGGYLAALAVLRRPDVFHVAIAGAPVTNWRLYDTHYTERYLGQPEADRANYERSDLIPLAPELIRPLLLIHGLADDNVVSAHTLQLSQALLVAGRPHTVLPLSGVTHMTPQEEVAENLLLFELDFLRSSLRLG